jgi:hypothetical protein
MEMSEAVISGAPGLIGGLQLEKRWSLRESARQRSSEWVRPLPLAVPIIAVALAIAATLFSATHGWLTLYNDARTHLDIARRVTDGLTPGLAQLGSVWLPLPQLLMAPLTAVEALWHSGAAGAIVSGAAFVYSSVRMFSLTEALTGHRLAAWCAFAVYVTNLNLLYMQSTALDESLMLACLVAAAYHLTRWTHSHGVGDLVIVGIATFLGTLTRYDGWGMFAAAGIVVAVWTKLHNRQEGVVQANSLLYLFIGGYGIGLWLLYNLVIFHDPLYFIHSTYSAQAQQAEWAQLGYLPTKGSVVQSAITLGWAIADDAGIAVIVAAVLGAACMLLFKPKATVLRRVAILAVLASPIAFNLLALFIGQTTIRVPQLRPFQIFNLRYGLESLPLLAVCAGSAAIVIKGALARIPAIAVACSLSLLMVSATPITLAEGLYGVSSYANKEVVAASAFIDHHYHGGHILADDFQAGPFIFGSGLTLREFVTVGFHPYYENAMAHPADNVRWIVTYTGDSIYDAVRMHPQRFSQYKLVFQAAPISLYELQTPQKQG